MKLFFSPLTWRREPQGYVCISNVSSCSVTAMTMDSKEKVTILRVWATEKVNRQRQTVNITIQAGFSTLEEILEIIQVGNTRFIIFVERRKPRWLACGKKSHFRVECKPPREETSEKEVEEEEAVKEILRK